MTQSLKLELNDQIFAAIQQQAEAIGIPPEQLAATLLEQWSSSLAEKQFGQVFKLSLPEAEKEAARQRFRRHVGAIDLGYPTGADNASIDADLIKAYSGDMS